MEVIRRRECRFYEDEPKARMSGIGGGLRYRRMNNSWKGGKYHKNEPKANAWWTMLKLAEARVVSIQVRKHRLGWWLQYIDCILRGSEATEAALINFYCWKRRWIVGLIIFLHVIFYWFQFSISITTIIFISPSPNLLFSAGLIVSVYQLATAGSDAAIIASIYGSFDSSNRELSNGGLRFGFGAVEVMLRCRWTVDEFKHVLTRFWRRRPSNCQFQTSLTRPIDRGDREEHFGLLFVAIRSVEAELWPWFEYSICWWVCVVSSWRFVGRQKNEIRLGQ